MAFGLMRCINYKAKQERLSKGIYRWRVVLGYADDFPDYPFRTETFIVEGKDYHEAFRNALYKLADNQDKPVIHSITKITED